MAKTALRVLCGVAGRGETVRRDDPRGSDQDWMHGMRLVFLGTGDFAVAALRSLVAARHEVILAVSQPDRPAGRGMRIEPTPVRRAAEELGLPHDQAADVNAGEFVKRFADAELGVVVAFGQKLGEDVLSAPRRGWINIHGSLLPKYRGAAPYQWAVLNGDAESGVTTFQLNPRWDSGAIWDQARTPIGETETADELHDRLALLGADLILKTLRRVAAGEQPSAQNDGLATRAPKLKKSDGYLDWHRPAPELVRWINGLWSWPTATSEFVSADGKRERVQLARAQLIDPTAVAAAVAPGSLRADGCVQCGSGVLKILEIKPAGKAKMAFAAFANGRKLRGDERLERVVEP